MPSIFSSDAANVLAAMAKSLAVIEFDVSGKILTANENFCRTLGYQLSEIAGQHHRMFADPAFAKSEEYKSFWAKLGSGQFISGEFKRIAKGGREVWIQASYNAVANGRGRIYKVVKFASDITAIKRASDEDAAKLAALSRSQAVIEFTPAGEILTANENFLGALGYRLEEIRGQHHRMFVDPRYAASAEYADFWERLRRGEHQAADFKRFGKGGKEVWIQASYNPILDDGGRVYKVVKFATDLTDRMGAVADLGLALGQLAEGDLGQRITRTFVPSLEPLRANFNSSVARLQGAMRSVNDDAAVIRAGADQMRTAADDLARRTEQQAAAIEQTSAALSEMNGTVKLSAKRADEAGQLVAGTKADAERSKATVGKAVGAMNLIKGSSEQIGKIIGVIDEIAFQTNLLALNAGVEAARAGEAGRGFAVVAQEVRGLAQRSAEAAKEIKDLISTSGEQVESGVELVGRAGQALEAIAARIMEINTHVSSIVEAARVQATGLNEINTAVVTLDQGIQQNAVMVEETTAASNELAAKAVSLNTLLGLFKLDEGQGARTGRRVPSSSPVGDLRAKLGEAFPGARRA